VCVRLKFSFLRGTSTWFGALAPPRICTYERLIHEETFSSADLAIICHDPPHVYPGLSVCGTSGTIVIAPEFPPGNERVTGGDNVLKQPEPAEADEQASGGLK
jgi:hypothetical protein